ncbi:MAG: hypothetical protein RRB22_14490 [Gammaproteobacteria bacterium]|nr:hypothetical protein [Gammaproteobacteria bacterium]
MKFKKNYLVIAVLILSLYQIVAVVILYNSSVLNLSAYYTYPPMETGDIGIQRLPMLFGENIALTILNKHKKNDFKLLFGKREVGLAAVLSSYNNNEILDVKTAHSRVIDVARAYVKNGYDLSRCEKDGKSVAGLLKEWGMLNDRNRKFILEYVQQEKLFECSEK